MRTNPNGMMDAVKAALPIAGSLYLTRFIINRVGPSIPGIDKLQVGGYNLAKPVLSAGMVAIAHYGTKKGMLNKWRSGIMLGTALNLIDSLVSTFAPADVRGMFGLAGDGIYSQAMGDYVQVGDYVSVNGMPIDDDITLSDYVEVGAEEDLGAIEEELGLLEDLGDGFDDRGLGGVHRGSMLRGIGQQAMVAPIPARSFTKQVPHAGAGYDKDSVLYTGIFSGGF